MSVHRLCPLFSPRCVAGCDEVGRGPLAGPVVAAAVILQPVFYQTSLRHALRDSKCLTPKQRTVVAMRFIRAASAVKPLLLYGLAVVPADVIDALNIRQASLLAMRCAVAQLPVVPSLVCVDGRDALEGLPSQPLIRGDGFHPAIQAASILAKVARDGLMDLWARRYPGYGFEQHKGYGTAQHLKALHAKGVTPLHRHSFGPVRDALLKRHRDAA